MSKYKACPSCGDGGFWGRTASRLSTKLKKAQAENIELKNMRMELQSKLNTFTSALQTAQVNCPEEFQTVFNECFEDILG